MPKPILDDWDNYGSHIRKSPNVSDSYDDSSEDEESEKSAHDENIRPEDYQKAMLRVVAATNEATTCRDIYYNNPGNGPAWQNYCKALEEYFDAFLSMKNKYSDFNKEVSIALVNDAEKLGIDIPDGII